MNRILLLVWVALAVAFAPLGSLAHARGHAPQQMHHAGHSHHHHHHDHAIADSKSCKDCDQPTQSSALKDCCQLGGQMLMAHNMAQTVALACAPFVPQALTLQDHTGTEPAQSDPPPRA